jgi:MFS family permease
MSRTAYHTLLGARNVRLYLAGQLVSMSGTWMQSVAQGWLVYSLTRSPLWLALVAVALTAPVFLLSLVGGTVADRYDRRRLLIGTQALSLAPAVLLGLLTQSNRITAPLIVALAVLLGVINAFDLPVRQALWGELVGAESMLQALSLNAVVFNATRIAGPLLAGFVIAAWGTAACFYLNAFSFVIGIAAILLMGRNGIPDRTPRPIIRSGLLEELGDGLRFVLAEKDLARILLLVAVISLFGIPFVPLLPFFADGILHVGPQGLGFLAASSGVGALAAALLMALRGEVQNKGRLLVAAGLLFALCLLIFARSREYHASLLALLFIGAGIVSLLALASCVLHKRCPEGLRGRVMGIYTLALIGMAPFGHAMMGLLAGAIGAAGALSFCSTICLTVVLVTARPISRIA